MDWQLVFILAAPVILGIATIIYFKIGNKRSKVL